MLYFYFYFKKRTPKSHTHEEAGRECESFLVPISAEDYLSVLPDLGKVGETYFKY